MKLPRKDTETVLKQQSTVATTKSGKAQNPLRETNPRSLNLMKEMDFILSTMRSRKISLSALHAVISLSMNRNQEISLSQLASNLGITTAAVTNVADSMEKLGFAKRTTSIRDRRLTWMSLTPRGIAFADWLTSRIFSDSSDFGGLPS